MEAGQQAAFSGVRGSAMNNLVSKIRDAVGRAGAKSIAKAEDERIFNIMFPPGTLYPSGESETLKLGSPYVDIHVDQNVWYDCQTGFSFSENTDARGQWISFGMLWSQDERE